MKFLISLIMILFTIQMALADMTDKQMNFLKNCENGISKIPSERTAELNNIAEFVISKISKRTEANLIFICTHNSRRSQMAQIAAKASAEYYSVPSVNTFSGGTEATKFYPAAVQAINDAGFIATKLPDQEIETYHVALGNNNLTCFSKKYEDSHNPSENFAAVMVCSDADEACPAVLGAESRVSLPYIDPKISDGTDKQKEVYDAKFVEITTEMMYVFNKVSEMRNLRNR